MKKTLISSILLSFFLNTLGPLPHAYAQVGSAGSPLILPKPGSMVHLSQSMNLPMLKGIKVHTDNPFRFDFIMDAGKGNDVGAVTNRPNVREESTKLIKYFLASLTVPEGDLWVNLSPYEKDRIIPNNFGLTEMGRDLLAQDYMLKQITASLIYPEDELGKKFWKRIYEEAQAKYGTTNIPVNTFNKVWIVPEKAVVYENSAKNGAAIDGAGHTAYVVESRLKVMLEADYLSLEKNTVGAGPRPARSLSPGAGLEPARTDVNQLGSQIVREIVIPALTREVNEGANFAQLRQVYNSLILATWYKKKIKDSILARVYADQNKVAGVGFEDLNVQTIYNQYLQAFKKGVYNYIKEEPDATGQAIPRKYFSGGFVGKFSTDGAMTVTSNVSVLRTLFSSILAFSIVTADLSAAPSPKPTPKVTEVQAKVTPKVRERLRTIYSPDALKTLESTNNGLPADQVQLLNNLDQEKFRLFLQVLHLDEKRVIPGEVSDKGSFFGKILLRFNKTKLEDIKRYLNLFQKLFRNVDNNIARIRPAVLDKFLEEVIDNGAEPFYNKVLTEYPDLFNPVSVALNPEATRKRREVAMAKMNALTSLTVIGDPTKKGFERYNNRSTTELVRLYWLGMLNVDQAYNLVGPSNNLDATIVSLFAKVKEGIWTDNHGTVGSQFLEQPLLDSLDATVAHELGHNLSPLGGLFGNMILNEITGDVYARFWEQISNGQSFDSNIRRLQRSLDRKRYLKSLVTIIVAKVTNKVSPLYDQHHFARQQLDDIIKAFDGKIDWSEMRAALDSVGNDYLQMNVEQQLNAANVNGEIMSELKLKGYFIPFTVRAKSGLNGLDDQFKDWMRKKGYGDQINIVERAITTSSRSQSLLTDEVYDSIVGGDDTNLIDLTPFIQEWLTRYGKKTKQSFPSTFKVKKYRNAQDGEIRLFIHQDKAMASLNREGSIKTENLRKLTGSNTKPAVLEEAFENDAWIIAGDYQYKVWVEGVGKEGAVNFKAYHLDGNPVEDVTQEGLREVYDEQQQELTVIQYQKTGLSIRTPINFSVKVIKVTEYDQEHYELHIEEYSNTKEGIDVEWSSPKRVEEIALDLWSLMVPPSMKYLPSSKALARAIMGPIILPPVRMPTLKPLPKDPIIFTPSTNISSERQAFWGGIGIVLFAGLTWAITHMQSPESSSNDKDVLRYVPPSSDQTWAADNTTNLNKWDSLDQSGSRQTFGNGEAARQRDKNPGISPIKAIFSRAPDARYMAATSNDRFDERGTSAGRVTVSPGRLNNELASEVEVRVPKIPRGGAIRVLVPHGYGIETSNPNMFASVDGLSFSVPNGFEGGSFKYSSAPFVDPMNIEYKVNKELSEQERKEKEELMTNPVFAPLMKSLEGLSAEQMVDKIIEYLFVQKRVVYSKYIDFHIRTLLTRILATSISQDGKALAKCDMASQLVFLILKSQGVEVVYQTGYRYDGAIEFRPAEGHAWLLYKGSDGLWHILDVTDLMTKLLESNQQKSDPIKVTTKATNPQPPFDLEKFLAKQFEVLKNIEGNSQERRAALSDLLKHYKFNELWAMVNNDGIETIDGMDQDIPTEILEKESGDVTISAGALEWLNKNTASQNDEDFQKAVNALYPVKDNVLWKLFSENRAFLGSMEGRVNQSWPDEIQKKLYEILIESTRYKFLDDEKVRAKFRAFYSDRTLDVDDHAKSLLFKDIMHWEDQEMFDLMGESLLPIIQERIGKQEWFLFVFSDLRRRLPVSRAPLFQVINDRLLPQMEEVAKTILSASEKELEEQEKWQAWELLVDGARKNDPKAKAAMERVIQSFEKAIKAAEEQEKLDFSVINKVDDYYRLDTIKSNDQWTIFPSTKDSLKDALKRMKKDLDAIANQEQPRVSILPGKEGDVFTQVPDLRRKTDGMKFKRNPPKSKPSPVIEGSKDQGDYKEMKPLNLPRQYRSADQAMKGGIDFNADKIDLQTRNEGGEIKFSIDPAQLEQLQNVPGFTPVIINIQPMVDLKGFLGISEKAGSGVGAA